MLKERHQVFISLLLTSDALVMAGAGLVALLIGGEAGYLHEGGWLTRQTILPVLAGISVLLLGMGLAGLYRPRRDCSFLSEVIDLGKAILFGWGMFIIGLLVVKPAFYRNHEPALFVLVYPAVLMLFLTVHRRVFRTVLHYVRKRGWNQRHFAIIGTGRLGQIAFHTFLRNSWTGINAAYFISHHDTTRREECLGRPVLGGLDSLDEVLDDHPVDGVVIALPQSRSHLLPQLMMRLERFAIDVRIIPDVRPRYMPINLSVHKLDGMPILTMRQSPMLGFAGLAKRIVDIVISIIALLVFGIPMGIIAVLVKLSSRGPVIFKQVRVSVGGKAFVIYKFRTMYPDGIHRGGGACEGVLEGKAAWTKRHDSRVTPIGRILRRTSLDELPQLFNVLLGNMSLVGPRPERLDLIDDFRKDWRGYMLRQNIKPGMTGWAQINGLRGDTSLRKRLQYDLYYIRHWSIGFDLRILWLTVFRGFRNPNAH